MQRGVPEAYMEQQQQQGLPAQAQPPWPRTQNSDGRRGGLQGYFQFPYRRNLSQFGNPRRQPTGPIICWHCHQEGHMAAYCPNPCAHQDCTPLCRQCGEEGHEDRGCPRNSLNLAKEKGKQKAHECPSTSTNLIEVVKPNERHSNVGSKF